jgi:hypothetical protein
MRSYHTPNQATHLGQRLLKFSGLFVKNLTLQKNELSIQILVTIVKLLRAEEFANKVWKIEHLC